MQPPGLPPDEQNRLEILRSLNLLDTPPEERFDRLTRIARRLFDVPISLVSLVDADRQWFKSNQGLEGACETPREVSFCGHAILDDDLFIVENALSDTRFADNPLVAGEPDIRFYAGCPLKVPDGSRLGTLCIIDREPREFTEEEQQLLKDLAAMVEQEIWALQMAFYDELTLIANRRGFVSMGENILSLCKRRDIPATLLLFDLNRFKAINDRFGHAEGDRALVAFADQLRSVFRNSDVFARLGGDEFVALASAMNEEQVTHVLRRLSDAMGNYNVRMKRGYNIEYSVGHVTVSSDSIDDMESLLDLADKKMYAQKLKRRERVG